jgi:hypothetical protein
MLGYGAISDGAIADSPAAASGSYTLTASAGAFTLSGQAANTRSGRLVGGALGSFTLTGQAANLNKGQRITAEAVSFTFTGQPAGLTYSGGATESVPANGGSTWQWSEFRDVPLEHYTLTAQAGRFALHGGAVRFRLGLSAAEIRRRQTAAVLLLAA